MHLDRMAIFAAVVWAAGTGHSGAQEAEVPRFDGVWRSAPTASCTDPDTDDGTLRIAEGTLFGVDTTCAMTTPVNVRDMEAVLYDMECEGAGDSWTDRAMFLSAADGGLILIWNGFAYKYEACPADASVGTVTTADDIGITD